MYIATFPANQSYCNFGNLFTTFSFLLQKAHIRIPLISRYVLAEFQNMTKNNVIL